MSLAASLILAISTVEPGAAIEGAGASTANVQVAVRILRAAIVRQASGLQAEGPQARHHQITPRGNQLFVEFQ